MECFLGRHSQGITLEERASLTIPLLILQGAADDKTAGSPLECGKAWRDAFTGGKLASYFRPVRRRALTGR